MMCGKEDLMQKIVNFIYLKNKYIQFNSLKKH